jgi:hypothetical protein
LITVAKKFEVVWVHFQLGTIQLSWDFKTVRFGKILKGGFHLGWSA